MESVIGLTYDEKGEPVMAVAGIPQLVAEFGLFTHLLHALELLSEQGGAVLVTPESRRVYIKALRIGRDACGAALRDALEDSQEPIHAAAPYPSLDLPTFPFFDEDEDDDEDDDDNWNLAYDLESEEDPFDTLGKKLDELRELVTRGGVRVNDGRGFDGLLP